MCQSLGEIMNTKEIIKNTYQFKLFHLFPKNKRYRSLNLEDEQVSSFLLSIRKREGKKGLYTALFLCFFFSIVISIFLDIYLWRFLDKDENYFALAIIFTFLLSIKFGFIKPTSMKRIGELIFTILSLLSTHYFTLTLLLLVIFESGEALSYEEV